MSRVCASCLSNPARPGRAKCARCRDRDNRRRRAYRATLWEMKRCRECKAKVENGTLCPRHAEENRLRAAAYYQRTKGER